MIGIDETIERRWGARIKARDIYRDPVRSSHGHFVKASGLHGISLMLLAPVSFAGRVWALPFLTALAPSERYARTQGRRHKLLTDQARQLLLLLARWLPTRQIIGVADSSYAVIDLLSAVRRRLTVITRLRLDARLFDPHPPRLAISVAKPSFKTWPIGKLFVHGSWRAIFSKPQSDPSIERMRSSRLMRNSQSVLGISFDGMAVACLKADEAVSIHPL